MEPIEGGIRIPRGGRIRTVLYAGDKKSCLTRTAEDTEIMETFSYRHVVQTASFHWGGDALEIRVRRRWEDPGPPKRRICLEQRK